MLFREGVKEVLFFGFKVPASAVVQWQSGGRKHVIAQAELLPVLVARSTWAAELSGTRVVHYVDNEGVREALIKGGSRSASSRAMLLECARITSGLGVLTWYGRVPSPSNPADWPSRNAGGTFPGFSCAKRVPPDLSWLSRSGHEVCSEGD